VRIPDEQHFRGDQLWGDDFTEVERRAWFDDEANAYADLYATVPTYEYGYDTVNTLLGYRHLPTGRRFRTALGLGSAYGDELLPIADDIEKAIIVESSDEYRTRPAKQLEIEWRRADPTGDLPLDAGEVDLAVCFGVLHHVPNVSHVVAELGRVVEKGGYVLIREPIISMGDWQLPRRGLTPRERGIPRALLRQFCQDAGFDIVRERLCFFAGTEVLARAFRIDRFASPTAVRLDAFLSSITRFNYRYHASAAWQKARPTSTFLTLKRSAQLSGGRSN
jgi:SAM-dependent methyltransferase